MPSDGKCDRIINIINRGTEQDQLLFLDYCANFSDMMRTEKEHGVNEEAVQVANSFIEGNCKRRGPGLSRCMQAKCT